MSGNSGDQFETEMKNVCKYRYNVDIDDFFVSNFSIVSNSLYSSELKYVYVQMNALPKSKNFFNADDLKDERWFNKIEARLKKLSGYRWIKLHERRYKVVDKTICIGKYWYTYRWND